MSDIVDRLNIQTPPTIVEAREKKLNQFAQLKIVQEVLVERAYQDKKYGGPDHDDNAESSSSFASYMIEYASGSSVRSRNYNDRTRFIKVAALAIAAVERIDRLARKAKKDD